MIDLEKYKKRKLEMLCFLGENMDVYGELGVLISLLLSSDEFFKNPSLQKNVKCTQIFSKFDVYKDGCDPYIEMIKLLERYDFLKGNCCEIGSGSYPRLAELMAPKLQLRGGSLTIYEPDVLFTNMKGMKIVKEKFTKNTDITSVDTLIGLYPCEATIVMAEKAFEEDKNLMLACCDCDHSTKEHPKWFGNYWAEDFCMDYREKYGAEAEIISWSSSIGENLPILVRQSSKHKEKMLQRNR